MRDKATDQCPQRADFRDARLTTVGATVGATAAVGVAVGVAVGGAVSAGVGAGVGVAVGDGARVCGGVHPAVTSDAVRRNAPN